MRRVFLAVMTIFVLFATLVMSSCSDGIPRELADYANNGFSATVSFERCGVVYTAEVIVGEARESEEGIALPRDLEICFTAPKSMEGIGVRRRNGRVASICEMVELDGDLGGWLGLAELLIPSDIGKLVNVTPGRGAAEGRTMAEFLLDDGRRCVIYIDNASGLPISVACDELEMQIILRE